MEEKADVKKPLGDRVVLKKLKKDKLSELSLGSAQEKNKNC